MLPPSRVRGHAGDLAVLKVGGWIPSGVTRASDLNAFRVSADDIKLQGGGRRAAAHLHPPGGQFDARGFSPPFSVDLVDHDEAWRTRIDPFWIPVGPQHGRLRGVLNICHLKSRLFGFFFIAWIQFCSGL